MELAQFANTAYLGSIVLFILALGGLSHPETARRGNFYAMLGMGIALLATFAFITGNHAILIGGLVIGGATGYVLARKVQMTQMPELVAILHSLVGLAALLPANAMRNAGPSRPAPRRPRGGPRRRLGHVGACAGAHRASVGSPIDSQNVGELLRSRAAKKEM